GNGGSYSPAISTNGRYVLFQSDASDLVTGVGGGNLFLRDQQLGTNYALTTSGVTAAAMTSDGRFVAFAGTFQFHPPGLFVWDSEAAPWVYPNYIASILGVAISPDGQGVFYWLAGGLTAVDRVANTNWNLATNSPGSAPGVKFSGDGRWVAYTAGVG